MFKKTFSLEQRQEESSRLRNKYPLLVPIIVQRDAKSDIPEIDKHKYLVPVEITLGQFLYIIRRRINLKPEKALYIFINNKVIPPTAAVISHLYETYRDKDGFLYVTYSGENTFGFLQ